MDVAANVAPPSPQNVRRTGSVTSTRLLQLDRPKKVRKDMQTRGIACIDLVEDRMRSRLVGVCIIFAMLLTMSAEFITKPGKPQYIIADKVLFASTLPETISLGPYMTERPPAVQVLNTEQTSFVVRTCPAVNGTICETNSSYQEPVVVTMAVESVASQAAPKNTLDCSSRRRSLLEGTLEGELIKEACTPVISGATNITSGAGLTSFEQAVIRSGPPGIYTLSFNAGDGAVAYATTRAESKVISMRIDRAHVCPDWVLAGGRFEPQPKVRVLDGDGAPLAERMVTIFVSEAPNFFTPFYDVDASTPQTTINSLEVKAYLRGQNYHLISGAVSTRTDANGFASWSNLTLVASSSKFLYLYFYCEGLVHSWNDPFQGPVRASAFARPPRFVKPIYVLSPIRKIKQLESLPSDVEVSPPPPPSAPPGQYSASQAFAFDPIVCPEDSIVCADDETEIACELRRASVIPTVVEGEPMNETFRVQLLGRYRGADGAGYDFPVVGEKAIAVIQEAGGKVFPLLLRPDMSKLWAYQESSNNTAPAALPSPKRLLNAVSSSSDSSGVVTFSNLAFSVEGSADTCLADESVHFSGIPTAHRLAFCTAGVTGGSSGADGCVKSCKIRVQARATRIVWSTQPSVVRSSQTLETELSPGEGVPVKDLTPPSFSTIVQPMKSVPGIPAVQVLDAHGDPVPGKSLNVHLFWPRQILYFCDQPLFGNFKFASAQDVIDTAITPDGRFLHACVKKALEEASSVARLGLRPRGDYWSSFTGRQVMSNE